MENWVVARFFTSAAAGSQIDGYEMCKRVSEKEMQHCIAVLPLCYGSHVLIQSFQTIQTHAKASFLMFHKKAWPEEQGAIYIYALGCIEGNPDVVKWVGETTHNPPTMV